MNMIAKRIVFPALAITVLSALALWALPPEALAKNATVAIEGMKYNVNASLADNLKSLIGKRASVNLVSGKTLTGFVKEVGPHFIHLEKLEGKEYYDALIRIENITAIEAMFRKQQR